MDDSECARFESDYARFLGVEQCIMTASGTNSLAAALMGVGIGPGDEVIVPACTYMATPISVLAAGAIPIIVDIDDSITISPEAVEAAIGPNTKAVIPVHMWGLVCDMDAILDIAKRHDLLVIEDACQGVGGAYKGKMLGSLGDVGAFSFNYYKNMTCGEGGAVVTDNDEWAERIRCAIDPCNFYWKGRKEDFPGFTANGARASEFEGALLNEQLKRIEGMIGRMREQKHKVLEATRNRGLVPIRANSLEWECGTHIMYTFEAKEQAQSFAEKTGGTVTIDTGRHVYTEWDPILAHRGAHHPALNPYNLPENRQCRKEYSMDMCRKSLDILSRTVFIQTHPDNSEQQVDALISRITEASAVKAV